MRLNYFRVCIHLKSRQPCSHKASDNIYIHQLYIIAIYCEIPAEFQPSRQRKTLMNIQDSHNSRAKSLCWDWRFEVPKNADRKTSFIRSEKAVTARFALFLLPLSVTLSHSLTQSVSLSLSFMMWRRSGILKNTETWLMNCLIIFFLPMLMLLAR